jgi:hypothetical protein
MKDITEQWRNLKQNSIKTEARNNKDDNLGNENKVMLGI